MAFYQDRPEVECENCESELKPPYIVCVICNVNICNLCFSKGAEFNLHENNHDYSILNDNIILFDDTQWTAKEELALLDSLQENQNFTWTKRVLPQYSEKEIKEHYDYYYLQRNGHDLLPSFSKLPEPKSQVVTPYTITLNNTDDPPRYASNSIGYRTLSGYNPIRGDFEIDYDCAAEELLNDLTFQPDPQDPDYEVITDLQCAIVGQYNRRLQERERRKRVIKNHGLICVRKMYSWLYRYDRTITSKVCEQLCRFAQFYSGEEFEKFMEGFHCAGEIKAQIARNLNYLKKGITTNRGVQLYLKLKAQHEASLEDVKAFQNRLPHIGIFNKHVSLAEIGMAKKRGSFSPLEIEGLPGYEKLTTKEQSLCRSVRLIPLSYLEFRDLLINENSRSGHLRLQAARKLLKIDVNKTRRLYDFLIQEGYINVNN